MQEMHNLQEEKLLLSQIKSKSSVEKVQRKSLKRASKHGQGDDLSARNMQEMSKLVTEQEVKVSLLVWAEKTRVCLRALPKKFTHCLAKTDKQTLQFQHKELKKEQLEALRSLCLEQYKSEYDLQVKYHPQLYDLLGSLMTTSQEDHLKKLDQIHDKEVCVLRPETQ